MADDIHIPLRRKLLYLGIVVALLLVVCEGGLRLRAWLRYGTAAPGLRDQMLTYDPAADLYVPKPGYEVTGAKIHVKINSLGFRGDEFSRIKPSKTFRIVCLGASTTFSTEATSNEAIWTHRLQEKLRSDYPGVNVEVVNAAVGGYVASDNLRNLRHRVLPLDPDLVIYYEANNEIVRDTQGLAVREGVLASAERRQSTLVGALSTASLTFDLAYKNLSILTTSRDTSTRKLDRVPKDLPSHFISVLDEMRADLAARNVPFLLSTFIVKYRRDQDRATQIANADVAFYYMPWMSIDGMLDAMDVYNAAILDYGKRAGLGVVDDRNIIPPDTEHFADCMHLADKGNEVMAERFHQYLRAAGVIDRWLAR